MKLVLEVQRMDIVVRSEENSWRRWHFLNCVLKDGDVTYFSVRGKVIEEGVKQRVLE